MSEESSLLPPDPAQLNWAAFSHGWSQDHKDYIVRAELQNDFFLSRQWDAEKKAEIEAEGKPALTLNVSKRVINTIVGQYAKTRADIAFKPRRGGATAETAHVLNRLFDVICDENRYYEELERRMFEDGLIEDRGYIDVRVEFDKNPLGEVKMRCLDPRDVIPDPSAKSYDPKEWRRVIVTPWMTLDDIEGHYGKAARQRVAALGATPSSTYGDQSVRYQGFGGDQPGIGETHPHMVRSVRVIDHQYRRMHRVREFMDPDTGKTRIIPDGWSNARVQRVADQYLLVIQRRTRSRVRWTVSVDNITIHDAWSPYEEFTVVPYFPIYRRGSPQGVMCDLLDPQMQLNKVESQILHTINTTANSGWVAEAGSLQNMTPEELEKNGAKSGLVLIYNRNRPPPEKIQPNTIPSGLTDFAAKARAYIPMIAGSEALMGDAPQTNVSGVALNLAENHALGGMNTYFENLRLTRRMVAERVLDCVQKFYTEERVYTVTDWRTPDAEEETIVLNAQAAGTIVNDITVGSYEVEASDAPTKDTWEDQQFAYMMEMRAMGVAIPDYRVVARSPIAGKREISEELKQIQGYGEPDQIQIRLGELSVQMQEAKLDELLAKSQELRARGQKHLAESEAEMSDAAREEQELLLKYELEIAKLRRDLTTSREELLAKMQIAELHATTKDSTTRFQSIMRSNDAAAARDSKERTDQFNGRVDLMKAAMSRTQGGA